MQSRTFSASSKRLDKTRDFSLALSWQPNRGKINTKRKKKTKRYLNLNGKINTKRNLFFFCLAPRNIWNRFSETLVIVHFPAFIGKKTARWKRNIYQKIEAPISEKEKPIKQEKWKKNTSLYLQISRIMGSNFKDFDFGFSPAFSQQPNSAMAKN